MQPEQIVKEIQKNIKIWSQAQEKLVVAIDGYAGSGKTTIANMLEQADENIVAIHLDDFIKPVEERIELMQKAEDKSKVFEFSWYDYKKVEEIIQSFKNNTNTILETVVYDYDKNKYALPKKYDLTKRILVVDGIFLFNTSHSISSILDKKIYLDIDFNLADKRRIEREKQKWGDNYQSEDHPDNWTQYFVKAYKRYVEEFKPQAHADLVVNVLTSVL
ncbi:MAG: uridine kinase [Candidatus Paceibacter sp.]|jgi:uridine kinase|nr:uridine kinase [Candidatus Paceibacter sp.]